LEHGVTEMVTSASEIACRGALRTEIYIKMT